MTLFTHTTQRDVIYQNLECKSVRILYTNFHMRREVGICCCDTHESACGHLCVSASVRRPHFTYLLNLLNLLNLLSLLNLLNLLNVLYLHNLIYLLKLLNLLNLLYLHNLLYLLNLLNLLNSLYLLTYLLHGAVLLEELNGSQLV
jgi:hypothetical protein